MDTAALLKPIHLKAFYTLLAAVTITGLFIPLMDNDSGEYAIVAMRMAKENDFINIIRKSEDYLDKPHLLFWLSALSMKIFGFTSLAYKLPSVLLAMAGIYATARLGTLIFNRQTGRLSGLLLGFSQAYILSNHDVRTDALLTGLTILAIYNFVRYALREQYVNIVGGAFFLALAVATKGMVAVVVTGTFVICYLFYHRQARAVLTLKWISSIAWFFLFLSPVLYCYYLQFDAHPEKVVKGLTNVSGVKFLLWGQSFERLAGQGMSDHSDYFFFFHTLLWAFLPWSIITYYALFRDLIFGIKNRFRLITGYEASLCLSLIILLLVFSTSQFKLPHYLNILFPLFSVLTANTIITAIARGNFKWMSMVFYCISGLYIVGIILLNGWAFQPASFIPVAVMLFGVILLGLVVAGKHSTLKPLFTVMATVGIANLVLNTNFYPRLLSYQAGNVLATYINNHSIDKTKLTYFVAERCFSLDYYTQTDIPEKDIRAITHQASKGETFYLVSDNRRKEELKAAGLSLKQVQAEKDFHITVLTLPFLNPATRSATLDSLILYKVNH